MNIKNYHKNCFCKKVVVIAVGTKSALVLRVRKGKSRECRWLSGVFAYTRFRQDEILQIYEAVSSECTSQPLY